MLVSKPYCGEIGALQLSCHLEYGHIKYILAYSQKIVNSVDYNTL